MSLTTSVEPLEGNKVRLHVAVPAEEFEQAIDAAFRKLAQRGQASRASVPARRRAACSRPGSAARSPASRRCSDALPEYYVDAVDRARRRRHRAARDRDHRRRGGGRRRVRRRRRGAPAGDARSATTSCASRCRVPEPSATRTIDQQVDALRERFADLADSDDAARSTATTPTIDIKGYDRRRGGRGPHRHRLPVRGRLGHGRAEARRAAPRQAPRRRSSSSPTTLPERFGERAGEEVAFQVLVKDAKQKVLPELTDEWVARGQRVRHRRRAARRHPQARSRRCSELQAQMALRDKVLEAAAELVPDRGRPRRSSTARWSAALDDLAHRLEAPGLRRIEQYLAGDRPGPAGVRRRDPGGRRPRRCSPTSRCVRWSPQEEIAATDEEVDAEVEPLGRAGRAEAREGAAASSNGGACWRRYALTSHEARRSSSSSITRQWSTRTATRSTSPLPQPTGADRRRPRRRTTRRGIEHPQTRTRTASRNDRKRSQRVSNFKNVYVPHVIQDTPRGRERNDILLAAAARTASSSSGTPIDDTVANLIIAQLLHLESRGPRQGHHHLHQLARRRDHRPVRDLRHDAVHQARRADHLHRPGRLGRRGAARVRRARQALHPPARPGADPPAARWRVRARRSTSRSRPRRSCACASSLDEILALHTGQAVERVAEGHRPRLHHERRSRPRSTASSTRSSPTVSSPRYRRPKARARALEDPGGKGPFRWRSSVTAATC